VDSSGVIYEAEASSQVIRKITPAGVVTTIAGFAGTPDRLTAPAPPRGSIIQEESP